MQPLYLSRYHLKLPIPGHHRSPHQVANPFISIRSFILLPPIQEILRDPVHMVVNQVKGLSPHLMTAAAHKIFSLRATTAHPTIIIIIITVGLPKTMRCGLLPPPYPMPRLIYPLVLTNMVGADPRRAMILWPTRWRICSAAKVLRGSCSTNSRGRWVWPTVTIKPGDEGNNPPPSQKHFFLMTLIKTHSFSVLSLSLSLSLPLSLFSFLFLSLLHIHEYP